MNASAIVNEQDNTNSFTLQVVNENNLSVKNMSISIKDEKNIKEVFQGITGSEGFLVIPYSDLLDNINPKDTSLDFYVRASSPLYAGDYSFNLLVENCIADEDNIKNITIDCKPIPKALRSAQWSEWRREPVKDEQIKVLEQQINFTHGIRTGRTVQKTLTTNITGTASLVGCGLTRKISSTDIYNPAYPTYYLDKSTKTYKSSNSVRWYSDRDCWKITEVDYSGINKNPRYRYRPDTTVNKLYYEKTRATGNSVSLADAKANQNSLYDHLKLDGKTTHVVETDSEIQASSALQGKICGISYSMNASISSSATINTTFKIDPNSTTAHKRHPDYVVYDSKKLFITSGYYCMKDKATNKWTCTKK